MADETDVLLSFCEEEWIQARQIENQRAAITNIVLVVASAILGLLSQKGLVIAMLPATAFLFVLGVYGALTSQKYYERHAFHIERARAWRNRIEELLPGSQINSVREAANKRHSKKFKRLERIHLHTLWLFLHVAVALLGIVLSVVILLA